MKIWKRTTVIAGLMAVSAGCGGGGSAGTGGSSGTTGEGGTISSSTTGATTSGAGGATGSTTGTGDSTSSVSSTSSTGSGPCTPKTCLTLAVEMTAAAGITDPMPDACGILSDGCANFIDCAGCDDPNRACGKAPPSDKGQEQPGIPNLCGGGCTKKAIASGCADWPGSVYYYCTNITDNPPQGLSSCHSAVNSTPSPYWCCDP